MLPIPTMPTSPQSRPTNRLTIVLLLGIITATCEMLGPLVGLIVRSLTPKF